MTPDKTKLTYMRGAGKTRLQAEFVREKMRQLALKRLKPFLRKTHETR